MTILLSGSTGFLGSYLLKSFINNGHKVIALKRTTSNIHRIDNNLNLVTLYNIDQIELSEIFKKHKIDIVINTVTDYGRKNSKISKIIDTNLIFGLKLLEESINSNVSAFINTDTLLDKKINSYALSKSQLVDWMKFLLNKNTKIINIKIEHMYGPQDDDNKFIYWLINQLKSNVKEINLTSGIQKRDFIYIDDIVNAYEVIINNLENLPKYEEFELGTGKSIEVKNFIFKLYSELLKTNIFTTKLNFGSINYRENEQMNMVADIKKLKIIGWKPSVSIDNGIKKIIINERFKDASD